ncbi:amidohydrolase [Paenibacillus sp. FSL R5-192]|uniref:amidohydrolase family protein n=1 Tax=Paenibacillus sp. FSL R5-192 TaxID=1226754 RepID=UPI0003E21402|nr:amidohydrolase family protein [Paenibacillus sp. FSL R5-192]ETT36230.1 amidohydrolase [Paenibacillus sp. FSL R5-192]
MEKGLTLVKNVKWSENLFDLTIDQATGLIVSIETAGTDADLTSVNIAGRATTVIDADGLHYVPPMADMHTHLDKHFIGEPWKSLQPFVTLPGQLEFEKSMLGELPTGAGERAKRMLDLMLAQGTTAIRTHVDVDPQIGLSHLEEVLEVREMYRGRIEIEIVAFPQQGLLRSDSVSVMRQALRAGANYVGGVDPAGLDRRVDASLEAMFELATEFSAGIDLHLHDPSHLGIYTISRFAELTEQAGMSGRTAVSHAYCLGQVGETEVRSLAERLCATGVAIMTSVPIDRPMPPIKLLMETGVSVHIGSDNILDSWSPFGNGDMLSRGSRLAEASGWVEDFWLLETYKLISNAPLTPKVGERGTFSLVNAINAMHALAAAPPREAVFSGGVLVGGRMFPNSRQMAAIHS